MLAWWARELNRPYGNSVTYRMDYVARCPEPGHPGRCEYELLGGAGTTVRVVPDLPPARTTIWHTAFTLSRRSPALPGTVLELLDGLATVNFLPLPTLLRAVLVTRLDRDGGPLTDKTAEDVAT